MLINNIEEYRELVKSIELLNVDQLLYLMNVHKHICGIIYYRGIARHIEGFYLEENSIRWRYEGCISMPITCYPYRIVQREEIINLIC
jgi:hypothetical protein